MSTSRYNKAAARIRAAGSGGHGDIMNKAQEIEYLQKVVSTLGRDSYSGPWLADQLPCIIAAITDDVNPAAGGAYSMLDARARAAGIVKDADDKARAIIESAQAKEKNAEKTVANNYARARALCALTDQYKKDCLNV